MGKFQAIVTVVPAPTGTYREEDLTAEITTLLNDYAESEGHTYEMDGDRITVTAPDGTANEFSIRIRSL